MKRSLNVKRAVLGDGRKLSTRKLKDHTKVEFMMYVWKDDCLVVDGVIHMDFKSIIIETQEICD